MYGVAACHKIFRKGPIVKRCEFSGGAINEANVIPAVYTTNDTLMQIIIETSPDYLSGRIRTESEIPEKEDILRAEAEKKEADKAVKKTEAPSNTSTEGGNIGEGAGGGENAFPEVTNSNMAKEILISKYGATPTELATKLAIHAKANELGVNFPNWQ